MGVKELEKGQRTRVGKQEEKEERLELEKKAKEARTEQQVWELINQENKDNINDK